MAGRVDSDKLKEKASDNLNDLPTFNAENMQNNAKVMYYSRTFMSIIGGVVAGILGLTGLMGFVFYFLIMGITSAGLAAKAGFSIHSYFDSWNKILLDGFFGGLMSFVLFWTFAYDIVHIF
ncbi:uncharacterized protein [Coffea arabica]|nr:ER membrane protein complex subunit 6-like [Coffea arabica]XP_027068956.1 ER membrane protein complex subunit 6-like [Coffea arabica]